MSLDAFQTYDLSTSDILIVAVAQNTARAYVRIRRTALSLLPIILVLTAKQPLRYPRTSNIPWEPYTFNNSNNITASLLGAYVGMYQYKTNVIVYIHEIYAQFGTF